MLLGGLRSAEVRGLKLAGIDMERRRLRMTGKGGKERHVPVDQAFFIELAAYLPVPPPSQGQRGGPGPAAPALSHLGDRTRRRSRRRPAMTELVVTCPAALPAFRNTDIRSEGDSPVFELWFLAESRLSESNR